MGEVSDHDWNEVRTVKCRVASLEHSEAGVNGAVGCLVFWRFVSIDAWFGRAIPAFGVGVEDMGCA